MDNIRIKDIARLAKVSEGTVDRVIHNRPGVSKKTKESVLEIIEKFDFKTNIIAKTLASKKKILFAVLIPIEEKHSSYWAAPLIGIKKAKEEFGRYGIKIKTYFFDIYNKESFKEQVSILLDDQPNAVVIAPIFKQETLSFVTQLKELKIPFNYIDSNLELEKDNLGYIGQDYYQSGVVSAKIIQTRISNSDSILLINLTDNPNNQYHLKQRAIGFENFFTEKGSAERIRKINIRNFDSDFINSALETSLKSNPNIKAIFVTNSKVHLIAKYLFNKKINEEIILVGYDIIDKNVTYLKNETIDYLISQNPVKQGYLSIVNLFEAIVLKQKPKKVTHMPINIVIKENVIYFS